MTKYSKNHYFCSQNQGLINFIVHTVKGLSHTKKERIYMQNRSFFGSIPPVTLNLIIINFIVWLAALTLPKIAGIDLNSRFEIRPGVKDVERIRQFIHQIKNEG